MAQRPTRTRRPATAPAPPSDDNGRAPARRSSGRAPARATSAAPLAAPEGLGADITGELAAAAPTFGEVLASVGLGVAASQAELDKGVRESAKALADKKVKFVNTVTTRLDDDGLPIAPTLDADGNPDNVELVEVSAINFFSPTVHEWKHVALSMDLQVGALDATQGFSFKRSQASTSVGGGVHWGFIGWFNAAGGFSYSGVSRESEQESNWSQGTVRLDAQLGPRRTERLPIPGRLNRGPSIFFVPGRTTEAAGQRTLAATIEVRKADGDVNPGQTLRVTARGLGVSFQPNATTDADGRVALQLVRRDLGDPRQFSLTVALGQLSQPFDVTL
jgi:hypothetical protein